MSIANRVLMVQVAFVRQASLVVPAIPIFINSCKSQATSSTAVPIPPVGKHLCQPYRKEWILAGVHRRHGVAVLYAMKQMPGPAILVMDQANSIKFVVLGRTLLE